MTTYGRIWLDRDIWNIQTEPHIHIRIKRVFGRVGRGSHGTIQLSNTPETCRDLEWFCERYPHAMDEESDKALRAGSRRHRETILRLERIIDPNYQPRSFSLALPPRSYQAREAEIYLTNGFLLIADDVGLGKTASAICGFTDRRTLPAVVVTLTHLPWQWEDEIRKFAPILRTHVIKKGTPYELPKFFERGPDVLIINYHKLSGWADVLSKYCKSIVFDEIQELRHAKALDSSTNTAKYSAAEAIASTCSYRLGLSATPIYNYGGEMFNVLNILKPGILGTWSEFSHEWCGGADGRGLKIKDPKAFGAYCREQFLMIRHTREEVGRELPPVIRVPHRIGSDRAALDSVENSAAELARIILRLNESERGQKWQASEQLNSMLRQATGIAKAPYVADFVRLLVESGEKVVLCGWHREVYSIWLSKLKDLNPIMYTGSETTAEKLRAKDAFVSGEAGILILSLRSGAGLDGLQEVASSIVFGELDWSPGVHEQCIGRIARDGQKKSVVAYFLVAEDGADPVIAETLGLKREQIEGIRNPNQDLIERLDVSGERARKLAEFYLQRIGKNRAYSGPETAESVQIVET
jgi:SNF2 family DNA or RNA helicase